ncbi:hypothetical protein MPDQ_001231 [Monascus purpureus]|uniref:Zn(2)-C6 fungal-type domain-containing protein n=1 Tax=Monascus purpureus TaxID=5098 RepID=A0A507QQ13_MONPU|nr:hypothetical protein MPDQ_001231 [Monascus purpureus]BDD59103.1 hypothetical protein MAP00_004341 [Monascus purpureus]
MDEGSHSQLPRRKRVSRACDRCRSKKDKCDGLRPTCSACQTAGLACSYDPHSKKRGLPEGYVRGLEKLWALTLCNIEGLEDTVLAMIGATAESAERAPRAMQLWTDDSTSETLHNSWKSSRLFGALENALSGTTTSQSLGKKRLRDDLENVSDGAEEEWGFRVRRSSVPLGSYAPHVTKPSVRPSVKRNRLSKSPDGQSSQYSASDTDDTLRLPSHTSQLLDVYFAITHSWLPIVTKHNILRASYQYPMSRLCVSSSSLGSGDHAALWAILSYITVQSTLQDRSEETLPKVKEYYSISRKLIPLETEKHELGHVQALLLLTLVSIGLEDWPAAWMLSGQAVRLVTGMETTDLPDEKKQFRAVFLGCFVIDSLLSFRLSRSPSMRPKDLASVGLLEEDGLEEWSSWVDFLSPMEPVTMKNPPRRGPLLGLSCFNRLVELASVLNRITCDFSIGSNATTFSQQLLLDLRQWEGHMPLGCRLAGSESTPQKSTPALLPHQSYLCLTYISILLWIYLNIVPQGQDLPSSSLEGSRKVLYRVLPLISQHLENFKMCGLPPIFECPLRAIIEKAFTLRNKAHPDSFPFAQWTEALIQRMNDLSRTWPVYHTLGKTINSWNGSKNLQERPPFPFESRPIDGTQIPGDPGRTEEIMTVEHRSEAVAPIYSTRIMGGLPSVTAGAEDVKPAIGINILTNGGFIASRDTSPPLQQAHVRQNFTSTLTSRHRPDALLPSVSHPQSPTTTPAVSVANNPNNSTLARNDILPHRNGHDNNPGVPPGSRSSNEIDSIFKDLAYLDTTEWATNREAGLRDFGFMDDTTFQAFCHDPDRLAGSQPLIYPSSIQDIWPPPGFFPDMFQKNDG